MHDSEARWDATPATAALPAYLTAVQFGDRDEAVRVALAVMDEGVPAESVIEDVVVPAQAAIGLGWQQARWSIAMEHRASGISEAAVRAVTDRALAAPGAPRPGDAGEAVVACSEGEWHSLPALMAAEVLRLRGADVTLVGPSVPAEDLVTLLAGDLPAAVAVTCAMPLSLGGAWRTVTALREMGTTVLCGGRGFGPDGRWARAIGADLWAADFSQGADLLLEPRAATPPRGDAVSEEAAREVRLLRLAHHPTVDAAMSDVLAQWPQLRRDQRLLDALREDLQAALRAVEAAVATGSVEVLHDHIDWAESVLAARGRSLGVVATAFDVLEQLLPDGLPRARAMAGAGRTACTADPSDYEETA